MASHLQMLVRSLMRKQTFEVSLLPSNGVSSPSADEKFDEETNLWKFSLYLRYCPNTTETSFEIWTSETRGGCLPFSKYHHLVKEDGLRILHCHPFTKIRVTCFYRSLSPHPPPSATTGSSHATTMSVTTSQERPKFGHSLIFKSLLCRRVSRGKIVVFFRMRHLMPSLGSSAQKMIFLLYGPNFLLFPKEEKEKSCNNLKNRCKAQN